MIWYCYCTGSIPPNTQKTRRYEQSLGSPFVEINIKQQAGNVIHLPVHLDFSPGQVMVFSDFGIACHSDMQTYTGKL